jgi:sulfur-carrier protein
MQVKLFGQLTDLTQSDTIEVPDVYTTDELESYLQVKYPALRNSKYKIAVDKSIIQSNTQLSTKAEVALLPPFSGG